MCIQYFSFNYQYDWSLWQPLVYGGFDYVEDISIFTHGSIINYDKFSYFGYTLIVHVGYPESLKT